MASRPRDPEVRIQALEALLVDDPTSPAFFPLAGLIWEKGEADKAVDMLSSGLQHHPVYSAPRVLLGEIYLAKEQVTEAIDELEKAVARTPWNLAAQRLLLNCFQKSGDDAGARKARVAIGMFDPADEEAFASLDVALAPPEASSPGAGSPVQDEAPLEESPDAVPTPSLAELYISQGHIDKALEVYTSLAGEEPENIEYMEKITELQAQLAEEGDDGSAAAELEDFDSILNEAEGAVDAADAGGPEVDDFDSIFEEEESGGAAAAVDEATDTGAPELEDFDSILEEAGVAADAGAAELEDFDSLLDEVGEDTEAVAEAPEEESGGLEDFDSLLEEAEGAADAGAAELEDFDSLLDEVGEDAEAVAEAPEEDSGGLEDFDSLLEEAEGAADAGAA
ncbi:MAG: hypothetical protein HOG04_06865, partial [Nitrospinaceae bacterium]|nr:hypothetical protein [Nitrospinaceae bacterium]